MLLFSIHTLPVTFNYWFYCVIELLEEILKNGHFLLTLRCAAWSASLIGEDIFLGEVSDLRLRLYL